MWETLARLSGQAQNEFENYLGSASQDPRRQKDDKLIPSDISPPVESTSQSIMNKWSIEATLPQDKEIARIAELLKPDTEVFLSTLPHVSLKRQIETVGLVRRYGLEPVLHIAARYFSNRDEITNFLKQARKVGNVNRVLLIGGDLNSPRGEFESSRKVIESGVLSDNDIRWVGIAGYPEGHPYIRTEILTRELDAKLNQLKVQGIESAVVTQFCFDAQVIKSWLEAFRQQWADIPVKIGLAGPTNARSLVKYAIRCGVNSSISGFGHKFSMAAHLIRAASPDGIIKNLDASIVAPSVHSAHIFSFGGLERTVEWAVNKSDQNQGTPAAKLASK